MSPVLTDRPTLSTLAQEAAAYRLEILGGFSPAPDMSGIPNHTKAVLLLGPREPGFWAAISAEPDFQRDSTNPLDHWSRRVIGDWAEQIGAAALFPFDSPPWLPFIDWIKRTARAWESPVGLLVHTTSGLWLSVRGALALPWAVDLPEAADRPCDSCADRHCTTACPIRALSRSSGYDTGACHAFLDTSAGADCMDHGCAVRRACPVSHSYPRQHAQSAFHMRAFHGNR